MKLSEVTLPDIKKYLRVSDSDEDDIISAIINTAKGFIYSYTGLSETEADQYDDLSLACMCLCSDMFDNRSFSINQSNKVNPAVSTILAMHSKNYL